MSTNQIYERWFILPPAERGNIENEQETVPKYVHDEPSFKGFNRAKMPKSQVGNTYAGLTQEFSDIDYWYITRIVAEGDPGWSAIGVISSQNRDVRVLANRAENAKVLINRFFGTAFTMDQIVDLFEISGY